MGSHVLERVLIRILQTKIVVQNHRRAHDSVLIIEGHIEMTETIFNVAIYYLCGDLDGGVGGEALGEMGSHVLERVERQHPVLVCRTPALLQRESVFVREREI